MKPNLSLQSLAATLAALGTSTVIAACGAPSKGAESPVGAKEVQPATSSSTGHASCSAAGCGAKKDDKSAASCGAKKDDHAGPAAAPATPAPVTAAAGDAPKADPAKAPTPATTSTAKPPAKKPAAAGQSACGAGTCSAKK